MGSWYMQKLKFAANLSTMFDNDDFCQRFQEAKMNGFKAVEAQFPYYVDSDKLKIAQEAAGVDVVLINSPTVKNMHVYDGPLFGIACVPGYEADFITTIHETITYATKLKCKKVHIIAGLKPEGFEEEDLFDKYVYNLGVGAGILEEYNIMTLIEPMKKDKYYLDSFEKAVQAIDAVGNDNLKLLLDVYHMHKLGMDVESGIRKYLPYAGHVQVSQAPNRNEPLATGEIDYKKVFEILIESEYQGYIGLEYTPSDPENGFAWLKR